MSAVLVVGDHATGVKAADRGDAVRVRSGDRPAEPAAEAVAGDPHRAVGELREPVQVSAAVGRDTAGVSAPINGPSDRKNVRESQDRGDPVSPTAERARPGKTRSERARHNPGRQSGRPSPRSAAAARSHPS